MHLKLSIDDKPDQINTLGVLHGTERAGLRFPHFGLRIQLTTRWPLITAWLQAPIIEV